VADRVHSIERVCHVSLWFVYSEKGGGGSIPFKERRMMMRKREKKGGERA
jgi:hypothetical protein